MTSLRMRRDSRDRKESLLARFAWGLGIGSMGQALGGVLMLVVALAGEALVDWSSSLRDAAFAGMSGAGLAAGFALVATRPQFDLAGRADAYWFTIVATAVTLPVAIGAGLAARPEISVALIVAMTVPRTLIGIYMSIHNLFVGGLGIGRPWWNATWAGVFLAFAALFWLIPLVPQLAFEAVPSIEVLGLWLVLLVVLALRALRFYEIDRDLLAPKSWSRVTTIAGFAGLVLAVVVVVQAA